MARPLPLPPPLEDEPVPDWHLEIVRKRLAEHRAHPEAVLPWEEVRDELLQELRERKTDR